MERGVTECNLLGQVSPDGLLLQSSTVSDTERYTFAGGEEKDIAGSYVEFAERRSVLPVGAGWCLGAPGGARLQGIGLEPPS